MGEKVSCMHRDHESVRLNCHACKHSIVYRITSFAEIDTLVEKIIAKVSMSINKKHDKQKLRFYVDAIIKEAVPNAVEHGILGIGLEKKRRTLKKSPESYFAFIMRKWAEKDVPVTISLCVNNERILLGFHDSGKGFDPKMYALEPMADDDLLEPSGKGLALLQGLGIRLHWNREGNSVLCAVMNNTLGA